MKVFGCLTDEECDNAVSGTAFCYGALKPNASFVGGCGCAFEYGLTGEQCEEKSGEVYGSLLFSVAYLFVCTIPIRKVSRILRSLKRYNLLSYNSTTISAISAICSIIFVGLATFFAIIMDLMERKGYYGVVLPAIGFSIVFAVISRTSIALSWLKSSDGRTVTKEGDKPIPVNEDMKYFSIFIGLLISVMTVALINNDPIMFITLGSCMAALEDPLLFYSYIVTTRMLRSVVDDNREDHLALQCRKLLKEMKILVIRLILCTLTASIGITFYLSAGTYPQSSKHRAFYFIGHAFMNLTLLQSGVAVVAYNYNKLYTILDKHYASSVIPLESNVDDIDSNASTKVPQANIPSQMSLLDSQISS